MKRILHITGGMQRAGAETMLMNLYRNLDRTKFQFDFLYFTNAVCDYDEEIIKLGGDIYKIETESKNKLKRVFQRYVKFYKLLKSLPQHQIIHSHINLNGAIFLLIAYYLKRKIRVNHSHISKGKNAFIPNVYRYICRKIIKKSANTYLACGEAAGKYMYPAISEEQIIVFPNSIDISNFQSQSKNKDFLKNQLNLDDNTKIIIQIGRFTHQKNFEFTVNFVKHLTEKDTDLHFVFLGTGPLEEQLKNSVKSNNLDKYITFYGVSSEIPKILHSADLFFMPSRLEGFPVVLVEAQACGIPCVISTNISPEVDMGVELITFVDLNDDIKHWESSFYKALKQKSFDFPHIKDVMSSKNFDAIDSVKKLEQIYSE